MKAAVCLAMLAACACAREPCMTGFDLTAEAGQYIPRQSVQSQTYAGGSVTVSFDTTGACKHETE